MRNVLLVFILLAAGKTAAHGEDKPGPHGGKISMPGAFHVELVQVNAQQLKVYLLDMDFKNPIVKESFVQLTHGTVSAKCQQKTDQFVCDFPPSIDLNQQAELKVTATRAQQKGNLVKYTLPLKFGKGH